MLKLVKMNNDYSYMTYNVFINFLLIFSFNLYDYFDLYFKPLRGQTGGLHQDFLEIDF